MLKSTKASESTNKTRRKSSFIRMRRLRYFDAMEVLFACADWDLTSFDALYALSNFGVFALSPALICAYEIVNGFGGCVHLIMS